MNQDAAAPAFIISFDCEGKWGFADNITDHHRRVITNANLTRAYSRLVSLLGKYDIKGTFAFVGALTMSVDEFLAHRHWFFDLLEDEKRWLSLFAAEVAERRYDGWFVPETLDIVQKIKHHEIASHGFCHMPLSEKLILRDGFVRELDRVKDLAVLKGQEFKTFVYPRNLIGYIPNLPQYGFIGYRESLSKSFLFAKAQQILGEFNVLQHAQVPLKTREGIVPIPSGYFLNWRCRLRKFIPAAITLRRWTSAIHDAVATNNQVIHLWTHPHNFIDGHDMYSLLERVLQVVSTYVKRGKMTNMTQSEYAERAMARRASARLLSNACPAMSNFLRRAS